MKGLLPILILSLSSLQGQEPNRIQAYEDLLPGGHDYQEFIREVDQFNRKLGGCPEVGSLTLCRTGEGTFDAKLWQHIRKLASKIFHLSLPKE